MPATVSELASRLAANAEAVCRHYLSNGKRAGTYWRVGDVRNTPGCSLYVRLRGPASGKGAARKWTDAATGEYGDLLDLIRAAHGFLGMADTLDEARRFLGVVRVETERPAPVPSGSQEAVQRLWAMPSPVAGTPADSYLRARGIVLGRHDTGALRFHPRCLYRSEPGSPDSARGAWPALVAAVTGTAGEVTGVQRTWLDPAGHRKASVASPRRAMGNLLGNAVRFGVAHDVMAAGEGIETALSLRSVLPVMPTAAALSAGHLASFLVPAGLRRLYIVRDNDRAGQRAADKLAGRMREAGIEVIVLTPGLGDFNDDLRQLGPGSLAGTVRSQLAPHDVARFCHAPERVSAAQPTGRAEWAIMVCTGVGEPRPRPSETAIGPEAPLAGTGSGRLSSPARARIPREARKPPCAVLRYAAAARGRPRRCKPGPPPVFDAREGRDGARSARWR